VVLDRLAVQGLDQEAVSKRAWMPNADADHPDGLDMAVADVPIHQTQRDPIGK